MADNEASPLQRGEPNGDQLREVRPLRLVAADGFNGWHALNDTVMGGRSSGRCVTTTQGLVFDAEVVETGGGFVSCRSPLFSPPLDLSTYRALRLELSGDGRRYKLAVACGDGMAGLTELIPGGVRWIFEFSTAAEGACDVVVPFKQLRASVRARPIQSLPLGIPLRFDASRITRLQLLHSKFGDNGGLNSGFRAGPLHLELRSIHALP